MTEKEDLSNKENIKMDGNKSGDGKDKKSKNGREKGKPLTKIVIRHLPPTMTEETFLKQIDPLPDNDYFYYVPADWSLGPNATCRAYINFINHDDIFIFRDKFDGYVFVDQKGIDFQAIVEYAPFQTLPKHRSRKKDNKCNSIETDQHYISFVEALSNEQNEQGKGETKLEFSYQFSTSKDDIKKITKTPLLEFLANKKMERKRRNEEQRKQRRDDERQKRKDKVVKGIPTAIKEEEPISRILVNEGDIMVRVVKSRLDRGKSGSNSRGGSRSDNSGRKDKTFDVKESIPVAPSAKYSDRNNDRDDNRRSYKDYKEERKRRDEKRRQERDQRKLDYKKKDTAKELEEKPKTIVFQSKEVKPIQTISATVVNNPPNEPQLPIRKEIKKYSEVRKERRARASASLAENPSNDAIDSKPPEMVYSEQISYNDDADEVDGYISKRSEYNPKETTAQRLQRESDERTARRIRNKDRPSIEIYRPKLRTGSKKVSDDEKGGKDSPDSGCDRYLPSSRRNSLKSVEDEDATTKSEDIPTLILEKKEKKLYEMSPDIAPFIPKSMQSQIEQEHQNNDVDVGPGQ